MNTVNLLTVTKVVKLKYPDCVEKTLHCVFAKDNMYHKCNSETRSMILDFFLRGEGVTNKQLTTFVEQQW